MSEAGFILIHRTLLGHPAFRNDGEAMAFAWMIARASWRPSRVRYKGQPINLQRGQLAVSIRDFGDFMDRPKGWCERLFKRLRSEGMIETRSETGVSVITICNYDEYQPSADASKTPGAAPAGTVRETPHGTANETAAGQPQDTEQRREEVKKEEGVVVERVREPISAEPAVFAHDLFSLTNDVCRAAGIRHIDPSPIARHVEIVKAWIDEGFDPVETIMPAVQEAIASATERISSLIYFDRSIRQFQARKEARSNGFITRETNASPNNPMVRAIGARRARRAAEGGHDHEVRVPHGD